MQLQLDWNPVHQKENLKENQDHLELNRDKFSKDCWNILKAMLEGQRLTTKDAMNRGLSGHLPRRIADLAEFKVNISKEWVLVNGKRSHIEYYLNEFEIHRTRKRIIDKLN